MLKPKSADRQHWDTVSDEELLNKELTIDNPLGLEGLVSEIPEGPEEPYVESSYDLDDEVRCVHGSHRHKHGFVFRKGAHRYLVGWICGEKIYGAKFDQYKADFKAAQTRQDAMRRVQEIQSAVAAFSDWATREKWRKAVDTFDDLRDQLRSKMPVVCQVVRAHAGRPLDGATIPRYLCYEVEHETTGDPRSLDIDREYGRFLDELQSAVTELCKPTAAVAANIGSMVENLRGVARRASVLLAKFDDIELFFQPATLSAICEYIDKMTPRRGKHHAGLLSLRNKDFRVEMPADFKPPSRQGLYDLERALNSGQ